MATGFQIANAYTKNDGDDITHTLWNNAFNVFYDNCDVSNIGSNMADVAAMRSTSDPYPSGTPSVPDTQEDINKRIFYILAQITGETYWYLDPDWSIAGFVSWYLGESGITISDGILTETGTSSFRITQSHTYTNTTRGLAIRHVTSGTMADNFGPHLKMDAEDTDAAHDCGYLSYKRSGADNSYICRISSFAAGVEKVMLHIDPTGGDGVKFVGPSDDNATQSGSTSNRWSKVHTYGLYNGTTGWNLQTDGDLIPNTNSTHDLGAGGYYLDGVYYTSLHQSSDERLKDIRGGIDNALDIIEKIDPIIYELKDRFEKPKHEGLFFGFSAQKVKRILGDYKVVIGSEETRYAISIEGLIPILWKGIQELTQRVEVLEAK